MAVSERKKASNKKWDVANIERLSIAVPKGERDEIKASAAAAGESINKYIIEAIRARMGSVDGGAAPAAEIVQAAQPVAEAQLGQLLDGAALESAKVAAATAGETLPAFVARAVRQAADADTRERVREANKRLAYDQGDKDLEDKRKIDEFALQFDREQARLTPEGRAVRTWDKLYQQQRGDILRSAAFRDYREIFSLQEIPPRERDARGFPPFDD